MSPAIKRESEVMKREESEYPEESMSCCEMVDEEAGRFILEDLDQL